MPVTLAAPEGAEWEYDEVKTAQGKETLGEVPLLVWKDIQGVVNYYGVEGILNVFDGTSLRVSYQGIARRLKVAGKTDDEIAKAILDFRPGKRTIATPTPVSRARRAAEGAAKVADGDAIAALLARIASGEVTVASDGSIA